MFTGMDKAIAAALAAILSIVTGVGVNVPTFVTADWLNLLVTLLFPVIVYFVPNKP